MDVRKHFQAAMQQSQSGAWAEAEATLRAAREAQPNHAVACLFHGIALWDLDQVGEAHAAFLQATQAAPQNALAQAYLALTTLAQGESAAAAAIWAKHDHPANRLYRTRLTEWMERTGLATGTYLAANRPAAKSLAEKPVGWWRRSAVRRRLYKLAYAGRFADMVDLISQVSWTDCEADPHLISLLGGALELEQHYETALALIDRIPEQELWPDDWKALRARCLTRLGRYTEAAQLLDHIEVTGPEDYAAHWTLGIIALAHDNRLLARRAFTRAHTTYMVDTLEFQWPMVLRALPQNAS